VKKSILFILLSFLSFTYLSGLFVEVGSGTQISNYVPTYGWYDYSWSNYILSSEQLGDAIEINQIQYNVSNTPANYLMENQQIYMKLTTDTEVTVGTPNPAINGFTLVYDGSITWNGSGWQGVILDSEFSYDGVSNLQVVWINNDGTYASGYPNFLRTETTTNTAAYNYADGSFPAVNGYIQTYHPNTRLGYTPEGAPANPLLISPENRTSNIELDTELVWTYGENTEFIQVFLSENENDVINNEETALVAEGDLISSFSPILENARVYYWKVLASNSNSGYVISSSIYTFSTTYGIAEAPYFEGFEDDVSQGIPLGWMSIVESTSSYTSVGVYEAEAYEGENSLKMYNSSDLSASIMAVLPQIDNMTRRMKFFAKCSSSDAKIIVGYLTDISDYTTFTEIETVDLSSDYQEYSVDLELSRTVRYLALKHATVETYQTIYIDNVLVEDIPENEPTVATLLAPVNNANNVAINTNLTWEYGINTVAVNLYLSDDMDEVAEHSENSLVLVNQNLTSYTVDLEEWTSYYWRIGSLNSDGYEVLSDIYSFSTVLPNGFIQIGSGTETNRYLPMEPWYGYTISQSIYDQELINVDDQRIEQISYYYNGNSAWTEDNIQVYLGYTELDEFTDSDSWLPHSDLVLVYDGPFTVPAVEGWVSISLDNPFNYNNEDNLVVAFEANTPGYTQSSDEFFCTATTGNKSIYQYSDTVNSDFINPVNGTPLSYIPNIIFSMADIPITPELFVTPEEYSWDDTILNTSANSVTFSMRNLGINTLTVNSVSIDQDVDFILNDTNTYPLDITDGVVQFTVTFHPLTAGDFVANITINDAEIGDTVISLTGRGYDAMVYDFPYFEGFEDIAYGELPQDWNSIIFNTYYTPTVGSVSSYAYEGDNSLRFSNSGEIDAELYALTPPIFSMETKKLRFNARSSENTTELVVGVCNSNINLDGFIEIQSIPLSTEYEEYSVGLNAGGDDNQFIVFKAGDFLNTYEYINIDNVTIEELPENPIISVVQDTLDFGEVYLNRYGIAQISIQNLGLDSLDIHLVAPNSELSFTPSMAYVESYDSQVFTVKLQASEEGDYSESFEIVSNDPENPSIVINTRAFVLPALPENIAVVGRGTSDNLGLPIEPYYSYSYSQVIYHADEICQQGQINKISWHYNGYSSFGPDDFIVYLGHTDKSQFTDNTDWIDFADLTEVYNDTLTTSEEDGWIEFELNTPFVYDYSHNLVVAVEENTSGYHSSGDDFFCTLSDETRGILYYSDSTNPDPLEPPTANYMRNAIANIQLEFSEIYHAPIIEMPESFSFEEDGQLLLDMSQYITDVDEDSLSISVSANENIIAEIDGLMVTLSATKDWYGSERLTFSVNDGFSVDNLRRSRTIASAITDIVVTPVNDAPKLQLPELFTFAEDGELLVDIAEYAIDPEGDDFNITVTREENVQVSITGTEILLRSTPNWYGSEQLIVRAYDSNGRAISVDTTQVVVTSVNDIPTLTIPSSYTFEEDGELIIDMSELIFDVEDDIVTISTGETDNIFVEINEHIVTLTSSPNWYGTESIYFTVSDEDNRVGISTSAQNSKERRGNSKNITRTSSPSYVNVTVTPVNDAPIIELPTSFIFEEDTSLVMDLSEYVSDVEGDQFSLSVLETEFISVDINNLLVTFNAPADWVGTEEITFIADDGIDRLARNNSPKNTSYLASKPENNSSKTSSRATSSASVSIQVIPENDEPTIVLPDFFTFEEDGELIIDMSEYAEDVDGEALTLTVSGNENVLVEITDLMVTLRGSENWYGSEQITFGVDDGIVIGADGRSRVLVSDSTNIIITPVNDTPTIELPEYFTFEEDGALLLDISEYVSDVDGDDLTVEAGQCEYLITQVSGMEITLEAPSNWNGHEILTLTINDNVGRAIGVATTDIIVTPVNDAPTIDLPTSFTFDEDGELILDMSEYANDIDEDYLTLTVAENENILLEISDLTLTLRARENWYGSENLVFTLDDGIDDDEALRSSVSATTEIFVTPVNDAPIINFPEEFTFAEDGELLVDMSEYILDIEEDQLVLSVTENENIIVTIDNMLVTLHATENWFGTESINFIVDDGADFTSRNIASKQNSRASSSAFVSIFVTAVNDAPTIDLPESFTFEEDGQLIVDMSQYANDIEEDLLTLTASASENIFIEIDDFIATFSASPDWNGTEEVSFTIDDSAERVRTRISTSASVNIIVTPVNDSPSFTLPEYFTFAEDGELLVDISEYVQDIDGDELTLEFTGQENITATVSGLEIILMASADWFGTEEVTLTVNDNNARAIASSSTNIIVTAVNDAPTIDLPESFTFEEDGQLIVDMSQYANDIEEDLLTLTASASENIFIEIDDFIATFSASPDWNGTEEVSFTIDDSAERVRTRISTSASVNIIVTPVNDSPSFTLPEYFTFAEDGELLVDISEYVQDIDGDELTLEFTGQENITATVSGLEIILMASADWFGTEEVTLTVNDNNARAIASSTTNIIVTPVNDAPSINLPESFTFEEDGQLIVDMSQYTNDIEEDLLTLTASASENIFIEIDASTVTLSATPNWNGTEQLTFTVDDGNMRRGTRVSSSAPVNIIVTPVNDAPTIELPTSFTFAEDGELLIDVSLYTEDIDADELTLLVSGNENLTATVSAMEITLGTLANWFGTEELTITVNDNNNRALASGITNIIVTSVNDAPTIELPVSFTFPEDGQLTVDMNDYITDVEGDPFTFTITDSENILSEIDGLMVTLSATPDWTGAEEITFTADDGIARGIRSIARATSSSTIDVIVTPTNDAPTIELPASFTFAEDGELLVDISEYVQDIDGDELTLEFTGQENITATISGLEITFIASADWFGTEEVTLTVNDSNARAIASSSTNIIVTPVNDAPTISLPNSFTFAEDDELEVDMSDFVEDVENDNLTLTMNENDNIQAEVTGLMVTLSAAIDWFGTEEVTFTVDDGIDRTVTSANMNIVVSPVNDVPTIELPEELTFEEDCQCVVDFCDYAEDVDGDDLCVTISGNENITVDIDDMEVTLCAVENWCGSEELTVTVNDNNGRYIVSGTIEIVVTPVNDAPEIISFNPSETEINATLNTTLDFSVEADDIDSELSYAWYIDEEEEENNSTEFTSQFTESGEYQVKVIVSDEEYSLEHSWSVIVPVSNDNNETTPLVTGIVSNYPNPFNPNTTIMYSLHQESPVNITIYDIKGKVVRSIACGSQTAGLHNVAWDGLNNNKKSVASGIYYVRMTSDDGNYTRKITLMK
jgi:NAD(P)H-hydrate repair Nnr-like enzyme with NAD(P)H-hydrate dehydratase domain